MVAAARLLHTCTLLPCALPSSALRARMCASSPPSPPEVPARERLSSSGHQGGRSLGKKRKVRQRDLLVRWRRRSVMAWPVGPSRRPPVLGSLFHPSSHLQVRQHVNPLQRSHQYELPVNEGWPAELFATPNRPLHVDIGCARGLFCIDLAAMAPDLNVLGLEIREVFAEAAAEDAASLGLTNAAFLGCNANVNLPILLRSAAPCCALRSATVQFPDPWFKAKHHKRYTCAERCTEIYAEMCAARRRAPARPGACFSRRSWRRSPSTSRRVAGSSSPPTCSTSPRRCAPSSAPPAPRSSMRSTTSMTGACGSLRSSRTSPPSVSARVLTSAGRCTVRYSTSGHRRPSWPPVAAGFDHIHVLYILSCLYDCTCESRSDAAERRAADSAHRRPRPIPADIAIGGVSSRVVPSGVVACTSGARRSVSPRWSHVLQL